jgi:hypothetical protein
VSCGGAAEWASRNRSTNNPSQTECNADLFGFADPVMAVLGGKLEGTARGLLTVGRQIDAQTLARPMPSRRAIAAGPSSSSRRSRRTSTADWGSPAETIDRSRARSGAYR